jgi:hypothetical protein
MGMKRYLLKCLVVAMMAVPSYASAQQLPSLESVDKKAQIETMPNGTQGNVEYLCIGGSFIGTDRHCSQNNRTIRVIDPNDVQRLIDVYAIFNNDQLKKIATLLETLVAKEDAVVTSMNLLSTTTQTTQTLWRDQAVEFATAMRTTVTDRFNQLPITITQNTAFKAALDQLKTEILTEVDAKIAAARGPAR